MRDGQKTKQILEWLNPLAEAKIVWEREFEGVPCSAQNLSEWRLGGYKDFLRERERLDALESLTDFAVELAEKSGTGLADGAAAIIAGQIVSSFEQIAEEEGGLSLDKAAFAIAALRDGNLASKKLELARDKHELSEKKAELDREKFERQTCEAIMKAAKSPEIQAILGSGKSKSVQLDLIHEQLFGKDPTKK